MLEALAIIFTLAIILRVVNTMFIKLPTHIGLFLFGILFALMVMASKELLSGFHHFFSQAIIDVNFETLLLDGFLGFLLFAGAIHVNIKELDCSKWAVFLFSTFGVLLTSGIVGILVYLVAPLLGLELPFLYSLLFGALISPTDPIAVLTILEKTSLSKSLLVKFKGESLFNDGIGIVLFSGILLIMKPIYQNATHSLVRDIGILFLKEVGGGLAFGTLLGFIGYKTMLLIHGKPRLATMVSLAIVAGGYFIAHLLHISGPLAMVVAGLIIGDKIRVDVACEKIQKVLIEFWKDMDEMLNTIVFFLMGLIFYFLKFEWNALFLGLIASIILLAARYISIIIPFFLLGHKTEKRNKATLILTWGGLRGGISIALALGIRDMESGNLLLMITFSVVCFAILVQGLTIGNIYKLLFRSTD